MAKKKARTSSAVKILHQRYYKGNPRRIADLQKARVSAEVACKIYDLRSKRIAAALNRRVEIRFLPAQSA